MPFLIKSLVFFLKKPLNLNLKTRVHPSTYKIPWFHKWYIIFTCFLPTFDNLNKLLWFFIELAKFNYIWNWQNLTIFEIRTHFKVSAFRSHIKQLFPSIGNIVNKSFRLNPKRKMKTLKITSNWKDLQQMFTSKILTIAYLSKKILSYGHFIDINLLLKASRKHALTLQRKKKISLKIQKLSRLIASSEWI